MHGKRDASGRMRLFCVCLNEQLPDDFAYAFPLTLMQAAQARMRDGKRAAVHAAAGKVVHGFVCGSEISKRDKCHIGDLAARMERRHAVYLSLIHI